MDEAMEKRWRELSEEVLSGMKEWRQAHPKATFREIEEAVHTPMSRLEAQMLQETTLASDLTQWQHGPLEERPTCPQCHTPLQARGTQKRELQSRGGHRVILKRQYGTCPQCGMGLFPPR
jgi:RNase P subunit RPR2